MIALEDKTSALIEQLKMMPDAAVLAMALERPSDRTRVSTARLTAVQGPKPQQPTEALRMGTMQVPQPGRGIGAYASRSRRAERDPAARAEERRLAGRLAVEALEKLGKLMDDALHEFGEQDTQGATPGVPKGQPLARYLTTVVVLRDELEDETVPLDFNDALDTWKTLIATVLDGISVAEHEQDFDTAEALAEHASRACEQMAKLADDAGDAPDADLLRRVVPYWKMKGAYSAHQGQKRHQRELMSRLDQDDQPQQDLNQVRRKFDLGRN
jgi:hypothetical protein